MITEFLLKTLNGVMESITYKGPNWRLNNRKSWYKYIHECIYRIYFDIECYLSEIFVPKTIYALN